MNRTWGNRPAGPVAVFMAASLCLLVGLRPLAANDGSSRQTGEAMTSSGVALPAGSAAAPAARSVVAPVSGDQVSVIEAEAGAEGQDPGASPAGPTGPVIARNPPRIERAGDSISHRSFVIEGHLNSSTDGGGVAGVAVSNVTASQRMDGTYWVDVYYDLAGPDGEAVTVWLEVSDDGGVRWSVPVQPQSLTGDVGAGVTPDAGKHIEWDSATDAPEAAGSHYRVRVCALGGAPPEGDMAFVPAGEFIMGDHHDYTTESWLRPVYVDAFYVDRFEITNQQYADALNWAWSQGDLIVVSQGVVHGYNGSVGRPYCSTTLKSSYSRITWDGSVFGVVGQELPTDDPGNKSNHPMVLVSWYGAAAYANWRSVRDGRAPSYSTLTGACDFAAGGYRLPTEAEWEKAARGGRYNPYYRYPWGDTIDGSTANYLASDDPYEAGDSPRTTPVGYYDGSQIPPGVDMGNGYGLYDMAGNADEYCNDWYGGYSICDPLPCDNPRGPATPPLGAEYRVIRGGSMDHGSTSLRCGNRDRDFPSLYLSRRHGFRLALAAEGDGGNAACGLSAEFSIQNVLIIPVALSNSTGSQRTDGTHVVDVTYELAGTSGEPISVTLHASDDGGATWDLPVVASSLSGDIGTGIMPGLGKHVTWNCAADLPDWYGALSLRVRAVRENDSASIVGWGTEIVGVDLHEGFVAVAAGSAHSVGLKADGTVVIWGSNGYHQAWGPSPNGGFVAIAAGGNHSLGLKADGSIVAWGYSADDPWPNAGFAAVEAGSSHDLGLKADGSIAAWGSNQDGQTTVPTPNGGFVGVAAGWNSSLGLKADGSIVAWGNNQYGQTNVPAPNSGFVAIAAGWGHSLGLKGDGSIVAWGRNDYGQLDVPAPNSGFVAIAAGGIHSLGLKADGSIVAWGDNRYGHTNVPAPNSGFVAIAAGDFHNLGLKADGSVVGWGADGAGQAGGPAHNSGFVAVAAGASHNLGLRTDGSITAWGGNNSGQSDVPYPNAGFIAVAAGGDHSVGLRGNGSIVAWGAWFWDLLPAPNIGFTAIAVGTAHGLALKANGTIAAWGGSEYGQTDVPTPNEGYVGLAAGAYHSLGLKGDGSIVAWGRNDYGQTDVPAPNGGFVAVAAGYDHSLGLKASGKIIAWGNDEYWQTYVPPPNTGFVAIAAGQFYSLGLRSDGTIVAWGWNNSGFGSPVPIPNTGFQAMAAGQTHSLALRAATPASTADTSLVIDNRDGDNLPPQPGHDSRLFDLTIHLDHLWSWDADAGRFLPPAPGQGVSIDPGKPTYLLAHGWDGALDGSTCGDAGAEEFTCSNLPPDVNEPDYAMSSIGAAIWAATSQGPEPAINLLAWDWKTAANPDARCDLDELLSLPDGEELLAGVLSHIEHPVIGIIYAIIADTAEDAFAFVRDAYRSAANVQAEGNALGTALADWIRDHAGIEHPLGTELHLIGKSHGGGVLGQAAKVLQQNGFAPDSLTTLDTPRAIPIPTWLLGQTHLIDTMRFVDPDSVQIGGRAAVYYYRDRAKFGFGAPVDGYHLALTNLALSAQQVPSYPLPWPDPAHLWISGYDDCAFDEGWYPVAASSRLSFEDTSPPFVGSALDVFELPLGYFAERSGDGDIYSFVPMGACCHDAPWPFHDWCDIRTQEECEGGPAVGTYGGDQTDCCAACGTCESQGPARSVSALSLLRHEPFQTAGIWVSSNGVLVDGADPGDPLNRVVRLSEVENGEASLFRDIAWPSATVELSFDYMFGGVTGDETLTVYWIPPSGEAKLIYFDNALTGLALDSLKSSGPLVVAEAAGTISRLLFVYRGSGAPGAQLLIDNVRLFGPILGDIDLDGDVDLADTAAFQNCFGVNAATNGVANACWAADLVSAAPPNDSTIGLDDYAPFASAQTGSLPLLRP